MCEILEGTSLQNDAAQCFCAWQCGCHSFFGRVAVGRRLRLSPLIPLPYRSIEHAEAHTSEPLHDEAHAMRTAPPSPAASVSGRLLPAAASNAPAMSIQRPTIFHRVTGASSQKAAGSSSRSTRITSIMSNADLGAPALFGPHTAQFVALQVNSFAEKSCECRCDAEGCAKETPW